MINPKRLPISPVRGNQFQAPQPCEAPAIEDCIDPEVIPCFTRGTLITTDQDELRVQDLNYGDRVLTPDSGFDRVLDVITVSHQRSKNVLVQRFSAQTVGNYAELLLAPGTQIFERSPDQHARLQKITRDISPYCAPLGKLMPHTQLYCILLESQKMLVANGAFVSSICQSELKDFVANDTNNPFSNFESLQPRR